MFHQLFPRTTPFTRKRIPLGNLPSDSQRSDISQQTPVASSKKKPEMRNLEVREEESHHPFHKKITKSVGSCGSWGSFSTITTGIQTPWSSDASVCHTVFSSASTIKGGIPCEISVREVSPSQQASLLHLTNRLVFDESVEEDYIHNKSKSLAGTLPVESDAISVDEDDKSPNGTEPQFEVLRNDTDQPIKPLAVESDAISVDEDDKSPNGTEPQLEVFRNDTDQPIKPNRWRCPSFGSMEEYLEAPLRGTRFEI
jgi:hypothetical protein